MRSVIYVTENETGWAAPNQADTILEQVRFTRDRITSYLKVGILCERLKARIYSRELPC